MRIELKLKLAAQILARELFVLADIGRNHLLDLFGLQQEAQAPAVDAGIVRDNGDALNAAVAQRDDQVLRNAAEAEAAAHHGHAIEGEAPERGLCVRINFVRHARPFTEGNAAAQHAGAEIQFQKQLRRWLSRPPALSASTLRWIENLAPVRARDENRPEPRESKHPGG